MKKIIFVVPYYGKFPEGFDEWVISCAYNKDVDFLLVTDLVYPNLPENFSTYNITFTELKNKIQSMFEFPIYLDRPWKLCEFRPAYGQIFKEQLSGYDFWGHCDVDTIFGNIRKFITEDILDDFEKIGFQGHCTLYKNTAENNSRYLTEVPGKLSYKTAFSNERGYCFDENGISDIFECLNIPIYKEVNFAHLRKYDINFFLGHKDASENEKNKHQVFVWNCGELKRYYLLNNEIEEEEYLYIHFWCRPMTYKRKSSRNYMFIYSDVLTDKKVSINKRNILWYGRKKYVSFYVKAFIKNYRKLTFSKIVWNIKNRMSEK